MPTNQNEIPVACPTCNGHALINTADRVVECFAGNVNHRLVFVSASVFDTLQALGRVVR